MFSFGIFSTHIPYVAFVAFYAWFLLFGVDKASRGEFSSAESSFFTELQVENSIFINENTASTFDANVCLHAAKDLESYIFKRKIRPPIHPTAGFLQLAMCPTLANRPPPCLG